MSRVLITVFISLLATALITPGAQGATKVRHFQGELSDVLSHDGGEIGLEILFKNKRSNKNRFTPRKLTLIDLERVPLRCEGAPPSIEEAFFTTTMEIGVKLRKSRIGRYSFKFFHSFPTFTGTIAGKVFKNQKGRGSLRANGSFTVEDLDFLGPGPNNCATNGPRGWSAFPCRTPNQSGSLPICRVGGGS